MLFQNAMDLLIAPARRSVTSSTTKADAKKRDPKEVKIDVFTIDGMKEHLEENIRLPAVSCTGLMKHQD